MVIRGLPPTLTLPHKWGGTIVGALPHEGGGKRRTNFGRQPDTKRRARTGPGVEHDGAAVSMNQLVRHEQAEPGALFLRCEIGLEYARPMFGANSVAIVAH